MDIDFKLDKVIELFDLVKRLSWGAIPLWFSLTLPVIYIAYKKFLPEQDPPTASTPTTFLQRVKKWISIPQMDSYVIYFSLAMFVTGTITLYIDQNHKEKIRNNGLRIKEYLLMENIYSISKESLVSEINGLKLKNINQVLHLYPNEFIEGKNKLILLMDSIPLKQIFSTSEKLLDSYLSDSANASPVSCDILFNKSMFFTRPVVYKLIADSSFKYRLCIIKNNEMAIVRK